MAVMTPSRGYRALGAVRSALDRNGGTHIWGTEVFHAPKTCMDALAHPFAAAGRGDAESSSTPAEGAIRP
jgi:hypothetical protein